MLSYFLNIKELNIYLNINKQVWILPTVEFWVRPQFNYISHNFFILVNPIISIDLLSLNFISIYGDLCRNGSISVVKFNFFPNRWRKIAF